MVGGVSESCHVGGIEAKGWGLTIEWCTKETVQARWKCHCVGETPPYGREILVGD